MSSGKEDKMVSTMHRLLLIFMILGISQTAYAESASCPQGVARVTIKRGHNFPHDLIVPDVGSDGQSPEQQWNDLTKESKEENGGLVAHCYFDGDKDTKKQRIDVVIPNHTKRCVLGEYGDFSCEAMPLSCPGDVMHAFIESGSGVNSKYVEPSYVDDEKKHIEWTGLSRRPYLFPLIAKCFLHEGNAERVKMEIPYGVMNCLLLDNKFSCYLPDIGHN